MLKVGYSDYQQGWNRTSGVELSEVELSEVELK